MLRYKNYFITFTNTEFYRGLYHIIDKIQDVVGMQEEGCLLLEELVTDGVEGNSQSTSEEQDEVSGQLKPENKTNISIIIRQGRY